MIEAPVPVNDAVRLAALHSLALLDTPREERFDRLTRLAALTFDAPIALISLIDRDRQWFKSCVGLEVTETPRSISFCGHAITGCSPMVIVDARDDVRFCDNPFVLPDAGIRFYAGVPLLDLDGLALGTLCIADVVPREIDPRQLAALVDLAAIAREELCKETIARTVKLQTVRAEALEDARARAVAASEAKSRFLANMSHELRTPLNAIIGYSELLIDEAESGIGTNDLEKIRSAGRHLLGLINGVLDLAKIEAEKMEVYREPCDLTQLLTEALESIEPAAAKAGNRLTLAPVPELPDFDTDVTKVRQILLNLLSNANKFTTAGSVAISASHEREEARDWLCLSVQDTGIGMCPEALKRIFEEYGQAEDSTTRRFGGTGLGLVLSRKLAQLLGGELWLTSTHKVGTTVTLRLPLVG